MKMSMSNLLIGMIILTCSEEEDLNWLAAR